MEERGVSRRVRENGGQRAPRGDDVGEGDAKGKEGVDARQRVAVRCEARKKRRNRRSRKMRVVAESGSGKK